LVGIGTQINDVLLKSWLTDKTPETLIASLLSHQEINFLADSKSQLKLTELLIL